MIDTRDNPAPPKRGRPRNLEGQRRVNGASTSVSLRLLPTEVEHLDKARGEMPRAAYICRVLFGGEACTKK